MSVATRKVNANGIDFSVTVGGSGAHPVVCMPGAMGTAESDFKPQLAGGLGSNFTVVSFDPRGYGATRPPTRDFPVDFYHRDAADVAAIMAALGHSEYSVMGWSDGANAACLLAAAHPDRVKRLVIWGGNSFITPEDIKLWEATRDISTWSEKMRAAMEPIYGREELQKMWNSFCDGMKAIMETKAGDVCLQALQEIRCPTLVMHGAKDPMVSAVHPKYFTRQISDATLYTFPEGKHNIHLRYADEFNAEVSKFLAGPELAEEPGPIVGDIAYAFMGSKAMFAGLHANVFDIIAEAGAQGATIAEIEAKSPAKGDRVQTLLTALASLKLVRLDRTTMRYTNSKSASEELVSTSRKYWGDYIKHQVDAQFYQRMQGLKGTMETGDSTENYVEWFKNDPAAAAQYTEAQHNGSLATAYMLLKRVDMKNVKRFLDVGGGSGAFCIVMARKLENLSTATLLDLPEVIAQSKQIINREPEEVARKIETKGMSAEFEWGVEEGSYDVVLQSYLASSVPAVALPSLYTKAYAALKPGGRMVVHDFMVHNSMKGPTHAAWWGLAHVSVNPLGKGLYPSMISKWLAEAGFVAPHVQEMIGGATKVIVATKPLSAKM
jgi:valacyclovir hydrolase